MSAGMIVPLKAWKIDEAERLSISVNTLERRLDRHPCFRPVTVQFNSRVVFVCEAEEKQREFNLGSATNNWAMQQAMKGNKYD